MMKRTSGMILLGALAVAAIATGVWVLRSRSNAGMQIKNPRYVLKDGSPVNKSYGPGDDLTLVFDLTGAPLNDQGAPNMTVTFDVHDPEGRQILETVELPVNAKPPEGSGENLPLQFHLTLPIYAPGGNHGIQVAAQDKLRGLTASVKTNFFVGGPKVPADAKLGLQDHAFVAEEGGPPVPDAAFAPGSKVRARFRMIGFKAAPDRTVRVHLDLTVLSESGEKLLEQPDLLRVEETFFYLPAYLPATAFVDTPPGVPPGRYRMQYKIVDDVSGTQATQEEVFMIK